MSSTPPTMGAYLRAARRKRRVSIDRAAEETRIRKDFLMRMESDEFDFLAPAYVRGFLRTYARFLNLNPEPFLEEFDRRFGTGRADTGQIVALQRRSRKLPRERKKLGNWALAGLFAAVSIALFAVVGLLSGDDEPRLTDRPASLDESPTPSPTLASPTPEASPTPTPGEEIALADGIQLEVTATEDCWVDVTVDGEKVFSDTIAAGATQSFTSEAGGTMDIVLGNAGGVDLVVNGTSIGAPGSSGEVVTINLPDDIDSLL